jgi:hypothetical protein
MPIAKLRFLDTISAQDSHFKKNVCERISSLIYSKNPPTKAPIMHRIIETIRKHIPYHQLLDSNRSFFGASDEELARFRGSAPTSTGLSALLTRYRSNPSYDQNAGLSSLMDLCKEMPKKWTRTVWEAYPLFLILGQWRLQAIFNACFSRGHLSKFCNEFATTVALHLYREQSGHPLEGILKNAEKQWREGSMDSARLMDLLDANVVVPGLFKNGEPGLMPLKSFVGREDPKWLFNLTDGLNLSDDSFVRFFETRPVSGGPSFFYYLNEFRVRNGSRGANVLELLEYVEKKLVDGALTSKYATRLLLLEGKSYLHKLIKESNPQTNECYERIKQRLSEEDRRRLS